MEPICAQVQESMYDNIKPILKKHTEKHQNSSNVCQIGLRGGANFRLVIFSFHLKYLKNNLVLNADRISPSHSSRGIGQLFKLYPIMFADDTGLLAVLRVKLQNLLSFSANFCDVWK